MKRRVTILHVIPDERLGGPQQRILQVAKRLEEHGFSSIVVMPEGNKTFASLLNESRIPNYQVKNFRRIQPTLNLISHIKWLLFFIPGVLSLVRLIRRNKVNIVHTGVSPIYLQGPLAAKLSGAKLVWYLEDTDTPKLVRILLFPLFYFLSDEIVGASKAVGRYYFGDSSLASRMAILYPPVDTFRFHPDDNNVEKYRIEFGVKSGDKIVGTVGNINPAKGYEYFFSAARFVKGTFPQAKFLVVGKRLETREKYWQRLHTLIVDLQIEDDVILAGYRADMPEVINAMDILILASVSEASPIVVLEAMACAKPVVATQVGGVPELVIDGETGIIVPPRNPKAISEAALYLLDHPEEAREMGLKGRRRAIEHFDIERCIQEHARMYKGVL